MLQAELLDSLAPDHPDALRNRRDLRLTNALMGNPRWFCHVLPALIQPSDQIVEAGAGTGELGQRLARKNVRIDGLDLWPRPENWPKNQSWHQTDLLTFNQWNAYSVVIGNLIFHQFPDDQLRRVGDRLREHARLIIACEPVRRRFSQTLYRRFGPVFGANHVSLHDAQVSIAAGFLGDELPQRLGLDPAQWDCQCRTTLLGAYRLIARRRS